MLIQKLVQRVCSCFFKILYSKGNEYTVLKKICSFLYGICLGICFYEMIIVDLDFTEYSALLMGTFICLLLGFGLAFSSQLRCIALLSIPAFGGRAGRRILKTLVIAYIVAGPITNLANNGKEVARVFSCTTSLTYNLTKTRFELMVKPFQQAILSMKADSNEIKDTVRSIRDLTSPITGELEGEEEMKKIKEENDYLDDLQQDSKRSNEIDKKYDTRGETIEAERYKRQYLKKVEIRCENQLTKAGKKCRDMFAKTYNQCYNKVTWLAAWILCWPMKLTFVCNIIQAIGGSKTCDPAQEIDPGFGMGYEYLKKSRKTLTKNFKDVKLQYKFGKLKNILDVRDAVNSAKTVLHAVDQKKVLMDTFFRIVKRALTFVCLKIIINAQSYLEKYLKDIEFDNIYITKYFRKIDARRKLQDKSVLLPLKKIERKKIIDPFAVKPLKTEQEGILGKSVKLILELMVVSIIIVFDRLFYEILNIIRKHARIDYMQTGKHDMLLEVLGPGLIASILRSIVKGFNIKKRIKIFRSNATCLPQPTLLPNYYLYKIYGTYFGIWLLIFCQGYIKRLRRVICAFYYKKREKKRILFLYNETLKRRIGFFRYMKKKVKQKVREQRLEENLNLFMILRIRCPRACEWLRIFAISRRKCVICTDPEPYFKKNIPGNFTKCPNPLCHVVYCLECWHDLGETCYACAVASPNASDFEDSDSEI